MRWQSLQRSQRNLFSHLCQIGHFLSFLYRLKLVHSIWYLSAPKYPVISFKYQSFCVFLPRLQCTFTGFQSDFVHSFWRIAKGTVSRFPLCWFQFGYRDYLLDEFWFYWVIKKLFHIIYASIWQLLSWKYTWKQASWSQLPRRIKRIWCHPNHPCNR